MPSCLGACAGRCGCWVRVPGVRRGRLAKALAGASQTPQGPGQDQPPPGLAASSLLPRPSKQNSSPGRAAALDALQASRSPEGSGLGGALGGGGMCRRGGSQTEEGSPEKRRKGPSSGPGAPDPASAPPDSVPSPLRVPPHASPLQSEPALCSRRGGFLGGGVWGWKKESSRGLSPPTGPDRPSEPPLPHQGPGLAFLPAVKGHTVGSAP